MAEGDAVVAIMTMTGTHLGTPDLPVLGGVLNDIAPTGKWVQVKNVHRFRITNGEITDHCAVRDDVAMMQQLGLLPAPSHPVSDISPPAR